MCEASQHFGPTQRQRQHDGVTGGHIGDRNADLRRFRHGDRAVGQRRAANATEVDAHGAMLGCPQGTGDALGGVQFRTVALTVIDAQRVALEAIVARNGERSGGIQTARHQDDSTT